MSRNWPTSYTKSCGADVPTGDYGSVAVAVGIACTVVCAAGWLRRVLRAAGGVSR